MGAAEYARLLKEDGALINILVEGTGIRQDGSTITGRFGESGHMTRDFETPPFAHFVGSVTTNFSASESIESEDGRFVGLGTSTYAVMEVSNLQGEVNGWRGVSIDGQSWRVLLVGVLRDGTEVTYSDASADPYFEGLGVASPLVGEATMTIRLRGQFHRLNAVANPNPFSPPSPEFPGVSTEYIDFGDVYDVTGAFREEYWFYVINPALTGQVIMSKDTGAAGRRLELGTGGSGALTWTIREQTPPTSTTATGLMTEGWHRIGVVYNGTQRLIYVDRTLVSTVAVTGSPASNAAPFRLGAGVLGAISYVSIWSAAGTAADITRNMFLPLAGSETNLTAWLPLHEGVGAKVYDRKKGSTIEGTLTNGMTWRTTSEWLGDSMTGTARRLPLGLCMDVPLELRDPVQLIYEAGAGENLMISPVRSNAATVPGAQYTLESYRGQVIFTTAQSGRLTADVVGGTPWRFGLGFDGIDDVVVCGDAGDPGTGSFTVHALIRPSNITQSFGRIVSKDDGSISGGWALATGAASGGELIFLIRNGGIASSVGAGLTPGYTYSVIGEYDHPNTTLRVWVNALELGAGNSTIPAANTAINLGIGARHDNTSRFAGMIDEVLIFNRLLTLEEKQALALYPADPAMSGMVLGYHFDEGPGAATVSPFVGSGTGTISGTTWTYSRIYANDLLRWLFDMGGFSQTDFDVAICAACLREVPGDCFHLIEDTTATLAEVIDRVASGAGIVVSLPAVLGGKITFDLFGEPAAEAEGGNAFTGADLDDAETITPVDLPDPVYLVEVLFAKNHSPYKPNEVQALIAGGATAEMRERYQRAVKEWLRHPEQDLSILTDPPTGIGWKHARVLTIESCFVNRAEGRAMAKRELALYRPAQEAYSALFDTRSTTLRIPGTIEVDYREVDEVTPILGMEHARYRTVGLTREEETGVRLVIWRRVPVVTFNLAINDAGDNLVINDAGDLLAWGDE